MATLLQTALEWNNYELAAGYDDFLTSLVLVAQAGKDYIPRIARGRPGA